MELLYGPGWDGHRRQVSQRYAMSYIPVSRRTIRRHRESERSTRRLVVALSAAAAVAWLLSVTLSTAVHVDTFVHNIAVVLHVLSLVVAFGAIVLVDWHGFLWLIGRRELAEIHPARRCGHAADLGRPGRHAGHGRVLEPAPEQPDDRPQARRRPCAQLERDHAHTAHAAAGPAAFRCLIRGPDRRAADPPAAVPGDLAGCAGGRRSSSGSSTRSSNARRRDRGGYPRPQRSGTTSPSWYSRARISDSAESSRLGSMVSPAAKWSSRRGST